MTAWTPKKNGLKRYPHFDKFLPPAEIQQIVSNADRVATNKFYPFMRYTDEWQPFRSADGPRKEKKKREIRYACRRDACIFSYYRHMLSDPYEALLAQS